MYVTHTAEEHRGGLGLPEDYQVDGFLCYGTYNSELLDNQLDGVIADNPEISQSRIEHPFLQNVREVQIGSRVLWLANTYGGAQLSELTHLASMFGSQRNILVGSCGGLKPGIKTGDIIVPTDSFSQDTSAKLYGRDTDIHAAEGALSDKLAQDLSQQEVPVWQERLITCQAMLGESLEDVENWSRQGYGGVEMEASTLFAVSSHFGIPAAALLYVGDNLIEKQTNLTADYATQAQMRAERQKLLFRTAFARIADQS